MKCSRCQLDPIVQNFRFGDAIIKVSGCSEHIGKITRILALAREEPSDRTIYLAQLISAMFIDAWLQFIKDCPEIRERHSDSETKFRHRVERLMYDTMIDLLELPHDFASEGL